MQETFLRALRGWDGFRGEADPTTWLYRIAANACHRLKRPRAGAPKRAPLDVDSAFSAGSVPDPRSASGALDEAVAREALASLEAAIAALPDDLRMPLVLKEVAGLDVSAVAEIMDLKEATVRTRLHRARLALRGALAGRLPSRRLPPPAYERQVCLDLLEAKQAALDRGAAFPARDEVLCERCRAVFASLDLVQEGCRALREGLAPKNLRLRLRALIQADSGSNP